MCIRLTKQQLTILLILIIGIALNSLNRIYRSQKSFLHPLDYEYNNATKLNVAPLIHTSNHGHKNITNLEKVQYALVHMPRTAGSDINSVLALNFERVCGNKANSIDYGYTNHVNLARQEARANREPFDIKEWQVMINPINLKNRSKIESHLFSDCDYVALEIRSWHWIRLFGSSSRPLEIHIPCREPVDFMMSMCNFSEIDIRCTFHWKKMKRKMKKCVSSAKRFQHAERFHHVDDFNHPNFRPLKCFRSPTDFDGYVEYMGDRLQRKPFAEKYAHPNRYRNKRKKENECIWKRKNLVTKIKNYLILNSPYKNYFQFCQECIGSENDLLA